MPSLGASIGSGVCATRLGGTMETACIAAFPTANLPQRATYHHLRDIKFTEDRSMEVDEEILSLDLGDWNPLYRIRRGRRILYVDVRVPKIIPEDDRTDFERVIRHLRLLPDWFTEWQTLTVAGSIESPVCRLDAFQPHSVPAGDLIPGTTKYDFTVFSKRDRISDRVFVSKIDDNTPAVVKIAKFRHELYYLRPEMKTYAAFGAYGFTRMPKFYGYVYEQHPNRVVGFAMEYLKGPHAGPEDLEDCSAVLKIVHQMGYLLVDFNRYNWIRTDAGMKVFDFEAAVKQSESETDPSDELRALPAVLADESGVGRR